MTTKIPDGRAAAVPRGITRPRAACSVHEGDSLEITVVADQRHWPDLEPRLAGAAAVTTDVVPSDRRSGSCRPSNGNANRRANALGSHHNVWLASDAASRPSNFARPVE